MYRTEQSTEPGGTPLSYSIHELKLVFALATCHLFLRQLYKALKISKTTCALLKTDSSTEVFLHEFRKIALFKISQHFVQNIFANSFLNKLQGSDV